MIKGNRRLVSGVVMAWFLAMMAHSAPLLACAACFGQSSDAMAVGMNMGILTLLGFIGMVLVGVASFFIFLVRGSHQGSLHLGRDEVNMEESGDGSPN